MAPLSDGSLKASGQRNLDSDVLDEFSWGRFATCHQAG
jgi:hypothetical protein